MLKDKLLPKFYYDWSSLKNQDPLNPIFILIELIDFGENNPFEDKNLSEIQEMIEQWELDFYYKYDDISFGHFSRHEGSSGLVHYYYLKGKRKETELEFKERIKNVTEKGN